MAEKIAVLGAGAIGGVIGGYLCRAGADVTLIDTWPAHVDQIRRHGLKITAQEEEFTVQVPALHLGEVSAQQPRFDVVLLCVKSYDTRWATTFIEPYLAVGGFVVSAQNSINEETIAEVVGWSRVVGCVVTIGAGMYEPGHVERTNAFDRRCFAVGEPSGVETPRVTRWAEVMTSAGRARTTTDLWGARWSKLAANCMGNAICGITGLNASGFWRSPAARNVAIRIAAELLDVATAEGVHLDAIAGIATSLFRSAQHDSQQRAVLEDAMCGLAADVGSGRPSLAQDVVKQRQTEVDALNGYLVRKGRLRGIPTPVNEALVELTRKVERGQLEPAPNLLAQLDG